MNTPRLIVPILTGILCGILVSYTIIWAPLTWSDPRLLIRLISLIGFLGAAAFSLLHRSTILVLITVASAAIITLAADRLLMTNNKSLAILLMALFTSIIFSISFAASQRPLFTITAAALLITATSHSIPGVNQTLTIVLLAQFLAFIILGVGITALAHRTLGASHRAHGDTIKKLET